MRTLKTLLALSCLGAAAAPVSAQAISQEQADAAMRTLGLLTSALEAENVPGPMKGALFACIHEKPLKEISAALTTTLDANPQIDKTDNTQTLIVLARLCGAPAPGEGAPE